MTDLSELLERIPDHALIAMAKAHDKEDAAQKGEPSPWEVFADDLDPDWIDERRVAMLCGITALIKALGEKQ